MKKNIFGRRNVDNHSSYDVFPATKEQRDKLLKAMSDAGWTFDFEKKELNKIEQNSNWNEEDEKNLTRAIWYVENPALNVVKDTMLSEWLKSIKERINYKKKLIDIIDKAAEWWLIHDSYSKDTNNLVNDFKKDLLKYVDTSE